MRGMVLLLVLGIPARVLADAESAMTFDDIVHKSLTDPQRLERTAELALLESSVASTGRFAREGPTVDAEIGPRRIESGATKPDAVARVEFPLLTRSRARSDADRVLREAGPELLAADAIASHERLRIAYVDAWLAQERLALLDEQITVTERIVATVRKRVEAGSDAPYEIALMEGEGLRLRTESDSVRVAMASAWSRLRDAAELPPDVQPLATPGLPDMHVPDDAPSRFEAGLLSRVISRRKTLQSAFADFEQAKSGSRWSVAGTVGKEGDDSFATVGGAYRFPTRGETQARHRERDATVAALSRSSAVESARLETLFRATLDRARRFGPIVRPETFDDALAAVALRMELGKDSPSRALPLRRQLLESRGAALQRIRDAHVLMAELTALTSGDTP